MRGRRADTRHPGPLAGVPRWRARAACRTWAARGGRGGVGTTQADDIVSGEEPHAALPRAALHDARHWVSKIGAPHPRCMRLLNEALCAELRQGPRGCGPHCPLVTPCGRPRERQTWLTGLVAPVILPVSWAWLGVGVLKTP